MICWILAGWIAASIITTALFSWLRRTGRINWQINR